jgi:hypothetical protein
MTGMEKQRMKIPRIPTGNVTVMETQNSSSVMKKKTKRILYNLALQVL